MSTYKQDLVYQKIRERILIGNLKNNDKVTERALAEQLGVTRIPIRESLVRLEQDGLIKKIPSKGYIVENYSTEEFEEALLMRFTIECEAASKAALNATKEDIEDLKALNEDLKNAGHACNIEVASVLDRKFHSRLVKASRSKVLNKLYSIISIPVFHCRTAGGISDALRTFNGHNKIIEAIENKDANEAFIRAFGHTPGRADFKKKFYSEALKKVLTDKN
ncbi:MAG: GntR family transcriptional regulator [Victivallales bacterium]|nr:GntR family transcriptional regulator [Victivallales bacterium]